MAFVVTALISYLLGSIPAGYLAGRAKGVDIRKVGSGNIGATNVSRILGRKLGILVLLVDALKGFTAARFVPALALKLISLVAVVSAPDPEYLGILAGITVVLGHNYTCWLRFKGGKGVATSAGVLLALMPLVMLIALVVWLITSRLTRYVSVASIVAALSLPVSTLATGCSRLLIAFATLLCVLAVYKHKANISRLMEGTENKIGQRRATDSGEDGE